MADQPQGNAAPEAVDGNGAPGALTEDKVAELVNRAITGRLQDYSRKQEKGLSTLLESFSSKLDERFASMNSPPKKEEEHSAPPIQENPEFKGMAKRVAEMEARARQSEERANAERAKSLDTTLRQRLSEELSKAGVDSRYLRHAAGLLVDADKRVRWSEDADKIVWRDDDGADNDFSLSIKNWAKGEDAKPFLPPRGAAGSGGRPGSNTQTANGVQGEDAAVLLMRHLAGA